MYARGGAAGAHSLPSSMCWYNAGRRHGLVRTIGTCKHRQRSVQSQARLVWCPRPGAASCLKGLPEHVLRVGTASFNCAAHHAAGGSPLGALVARARNAGLWRTCHRQEGCRGAHVVGDGE